jgi:hypothetical protein
MLLKGGEKLMNKEYREIIDKFIAAIKKKLPGWLKDKKDECKEVLDEIEEHIYDKIDALAGGQPISEVHVIEAIGSMGTPETIAAEYKKRGTPKVFISEELFPLFKKTEKIVLNILFAINLTVFIVKLVIEPEWQLLWEFVTSIWASLVPVAVVIAVIFIGLSMEGFFPEDLKDSEKDHSRVHIKTEYDSVKAEIKAEIQSEIKAEINKDFMKKELRKKKKHPVQPGDLISSGIFSLIFAYLIFTQPWGLLLNFLRPEYLIYLKAYAVIPLAEGIIELTRGVIGKNNIFGQRVFMLGNVVVDILSITFLIQVKNSEVLRQFRFGAEAVWNTIPEWVLLIIIIFVIIGILEKLGKIGTLRRRVETFNRYQ